MAATIKAVIMNVEPDPLHTGRTIVSVQFDDGDKVRRPWIQGFSLLPPDRPITPEELMRDIRKQRIERPVDNFAFIKGAKGKQYEINISDVEPDPPA